MRRIFVLLGATALIAAGCNGDPAPEPMPEEEAVDDYDISDQPADAQAMFVTPSDGDTVSAPVQVEMAADGVEIVPADAPRVGEAHFHINVDIGCVAPGEVIPGPSEEATEQGYLHFGDGSTQAELDLEPGTYELCLGLADGVHFAFGETDTITITVE